MEANGSRSAVAKVWTVMDVRNWAVPYLTKADVDSPRKTIEILLCAVLRTDRLGLYLQFERLLSPTELATLRSMIDRRVRSREPLQYIVGTTNFYGLEISVDSRVLIPRPETERLVERAVEIIDEILRAQARCTVLDIGTGSGCIALAIAANVKGVDVTAVDVSEGALELARANAERLGATGVVFENRDVLRDESWDGTFDVVVSNPPYVAQSDMGTLDPEVRDHEPTGALTDAGDGFAFYRRFATLFPGLVSPHGAFLVEVGYEMAETVSALFGDWNTVVHTDLEGRERFVEGRGFRGITR